MKKLFLLLAFMLAALPAFAQVSTTSVSGTISDANGQAFVSGTWSAVLIAASGGTGQPFVCNGITLSSAQVQQSGNLDSSGAFTATMVSNSCISPSGSLWQFTFIPAATSAPYSQSVFIFGTTQSLTSTITPPAITVNNSAVFTIAYTDAEVFGFKEGSFYWNVLTPALRVYHSGSWTTVGGGGGSGTVTSIATTSPITGGTITTTGTIGCATCGVTGSPLSQFASTTSAQLAGVLSDEASVGGGLALFASGFQGTDSNALTAGTVSGSGVTLCTDSNGGATTTGCSAGGNTTSTSGTSGFYSKFSGTNSIINGTCDSGITTANTFTCSDTAGAAFAGPVKVAGTTAGGNVLTAGTANGHATASTVTVEAPAAVTAYELVLPGTSASGIVRRANASNVDTESISEMSGDATTSGSNALTLATVNTNVGSFTAANITVNGKGLITAASNGSAGVTVTKDSLTGQTANIGSRTLLTPGGNGLYRAQAYIVTTTAAATTSTLPIVQITFTDADTSVAKTLDVTNTSGTNAVGNFGPGGYSVGVTANGMINAKSGVAIQWDTTSYASNLANTMTYSVYVVLEGPF